MKFESIADCGLPRPIAVGVLRLPISTRRVVPEVLVGLVATTLMLLACSATAEDYEIREGYLSASVREVVEGYGWTLIWAAEEDRLVEHAYTVSNGSLPDVVTNILVMYGGHLVADLYEGNEVIVIDSAPPRMRVLLPGEAVDTAGDLAAADTSATRPAGPREPAELTELEPFRTDQVAAEAQVLGRQPSQGATDVDGG